MILPFSFPHSLSLSLLSFCLSLFFSLFIPSFFHSVSHFFLISFVRSFFFLSFTKTWMRNGRDQFYWSCIGGRAQRPRALELASTRVCRSITPAILLEPPGPGSRVQHAGCRRTKTSEGDSPRVAVPKASSQSLINVVPRWEAPSYCTP